MTYNEADAKIKAIVDKPFLDKLSEVAKLYGWRGDYIEVGTFVQNLYEELNLEAPDLQPYELTE